MTHHREHEEAYNQYQGAPHQAKLSHQVIAGAAAYEAMKAYNEHREKKGEAVNHSTAKEIAAGLAGVALDRLIETKGLDALDNFNNKREREKLREHTVNETNRYFNS